MDAGWDGTVVRSRWSPLDTARGGCRRHPQRAPFSRPRPLSGDQPDPLARLPVDTYRHRLGNVETRGPLAKRDVKQRGAKNGESENSETKSQGSPCATPLIARGTPSRFCEPENRGACRRGSNCLKNG